MDLTDEQIQQLHAQAESGELFANIAQRLLIIHPSFETEQTFDLEAHRILDRLIEEMQYCQGKFELRPSRD